MRHGTLAALGVAGLWLLFAATASAEGFDAPAGKLTIDGKGPYEGTVGTVCVNTSNVSGCSDAVWITPPDGPTARPEARLQFSLGDGRKINSWGAADSKPGASEPGDQLASADHNSSATIEFEGPPRGDWVVAIYVEYDGGNAVYYFRIHAGMPETDVAAAVPPRLPGSAAPVLPMLLTLGAGAALAGWRMGSTESPAH